MWAGGNTNTPNANALKCINEMTPSAFFLEKANRYEFSWYHVLTFSEVID